ncbi:hypothetical protein RFI_16750, partial [Reticulomyxa filosa]
GIQLLVLGSIECEHGIEVISKTVTVNTPMSSINGGNSDDDSGVEDRDMASGHVKSDSRKKNQQKEAEYEDEEQEEQQGQKPTLCVIHSNQAMPDDVYMGDFIVNSVQTSQKTKSRPRKVAKNKQSKVLLCFTSTTLCKLKSFLQFILFYLLLYYFFFFVDVVFLLFSLVI